MNHDTWKTSLATFSHCECGEELSSVFLEDDRTEQGVCIKCEKQAEIQALEKQYDEDYASCGTHLEEMIEELGKILTEKNKQERSVA